ncbi:nucleoporin Nup120/160-domain-containing protein [Peziza echinospora]|nr:nucleoporin Nup120/160-domain-containing protein [Peziza echinospora]
MVDRACVLFKETRISTDPVSQNDGITVRLPSHRTSASYPTRRRSVQLRTSSPGPLGSSTEKQKDIEAIFGYNCLAKAASMYFRRPGVSPRAILYRIVEDWEVLIIQAADVARETATATGAESTSPQLRFHFPDRIREHCVGIADVPGKDEVVIYVMTVVNTVYTLTLKGEIFRTGNGAAARGGRGGGVGLGNMKEPEFCRTYSPTSFSLHPPHFLVAVDHERILVSLQDGVLLKLERGEESDVPEMTESVYSEKTFSDSSYFGFVKNKLPWMTSGTSRYRDAIVSHSTVISTAIFSTPDNFESSADRAMVGYSTSERKGTLLFTVSINHMLKVWSLEKGTLLHACDLINEPQTNSNIKTILDPTPAQLLAVMPTPLHENHLFYLASYSAASTGTFKFWAGICDSEGTFSGLEDMYQEFTFDAIPPTASSVWIISDFRITPASRTDVGIYNMWILWKSNTSFKIQNLQFHLNNIPAAWTNWTTSITESLHTLPSKTPPISASEDVTDGWMDWIFYPERFPDTVIEAALEIYQQHFSRSINVRTSKTVSIRGRVGKSVASAIELQRTMDGSLNYEKYRHEVSLQWDRFVRLCVELDRQRGEALSLVADPELGFIWAVNADGITALRECTELEMIIHNQSASAETYELLTTRTPHKLGAGLQPKDLGDVMMILRAATDLMNSLPPGSIEQCTDAIQKEILQDPLYSVGDRMWALLDNCIAGKVPDNVLDKIDNTFAVLPEPDTTIQAILSSIFNPSIQPGTAKLTEFGAKVLAKGAQEVIHMNYTTLFSLAFLIPLATFPDDGQQRRIANAEGLFSQVLGYLKEYEVLKWMAKTSIAITEASTPEEVLSATLSGLKVSEASSDMPARNGSVLQLVLPEAGGIIPARQSSLTASIRSFLAKLDLADYERGSTTIAAALIRAHINTLALDFLRFLPNTNWGCYVKARVLLNNRSEEEAAVLFKKAAAGLGYPTQQPPSPALESIIGDGELTAFGNGLPQYYIHVAKLFEDTEVWGLVVEFCRAALLTLGNKATEDSFRMGILSKMFQASIQVSMFDEAYIALIQYNSKHLQLLALKNLVEAMVEQEQGLRLCSFPFIGLQDEVDEILSGRCETILDVNAGPPFHKVLYAWRIQRGDFRGAAAVLHQRLQRTKTASVGASDSQSKSVTDGFLALLNVLHCVDEDQAWILSSGRTDGENIGSGAAGQGGGTVAKRTKTARNGLTGAPHKRQVLTLKDITEEYQRETDRQGLLLHGGFFV